MVVVAQVLQYLLPGGGGHPQCWWTCRWRTCCRRRPWWIKRPWRSSQLSSQLAVGFCSLKLCHSHTGCETTGQDFLYCPSEKGIEDGRGELTSSASIGSGDLAVPSWLGRCWELRRGLLWCAHKENWSFLILSTVLLLMCSGEWSTRVLLKSTINSLVSSTLRDRLLCLHQSVSCSISSLLLHCCWRDPQLYCLQQTWWCYLNCTLQHNHEYSALGSTGVQCGAAGGGVANPDWMGSPGQEVQDPVAEVGQT